MFLYNETVNIIIIFSSKNLMGFEHFYEIKTIDSFAGCGHPAVKFSESYTLGKFIFFCSFFHLNSVWSTYMPL